jgi:hypothetical protein
VVDLGVLAGAEDGFELPESTEGRSCIEVRGIHRVEESARLRRRWKVADICRSEDSLVRRQSSDCFGEVD